MYNFHKRLCWMCPCSGANVIKLFTTFHNKLERLSLASLFSLVYCLWVPPGAYPRVERLKGSLRPYPQTLARLERLARDKRSSLLQKFATFGRKKIYNSPWSQFTSNALKMKKRRIWTGGISLHPPFNFTPCFYMRLFVSKAATTKRSRIPRCTKLARLSLSATLRRLREPGLAGPLMQA